MSTNHIQDNELNPKYLCSILLPARYRVNNTKKSITTIQRTASYPENIQFVLRIDEDDDETNAAFNAGYLESCADKSEIIIIRKPRLNVPFAERFAAMFRECVQESKGQWLWLMNYDCFVHEKSVGWDEKLKRAPTTGYIAVPEVNLWCDKWVHNQWHAWHFPLVPNGWWKEFGLSRMEHPVDTWTLNYLTGLGYNGHPPAAGWRIYELTGLATVHTQVEDKCFKESGRNSFTDY
jgi:hypothetical protein